MRTSHRTRRIARCTPHRGMFSAIVGLCMFGVDLSQITNAEEAQTPLAECRVQAITISPPSEMQAGVMLPPSQQPAAIITANYQRSPTGDWKVPSDVDADDSLVRLLLLTPGGPLLMDLSILVDGVSFRRTSEGWITDALTPKATVEEPSDAPVDVNPSDDATDASSSTEVAAATEPEVEESEEAGGTSAERFEPAAALARLQKYAAQPGLDVGRDEARWLLAQWSPGPTLLELRPTFAAERSRLAPLWTALDEDRNGELSATEIASARTTLRGLDTDEDDWVDQSELTTSPLTAMWTSFPLVTCLEPNTDWSQLARQFRGSFADDAAAPLMEQLLKTLGVASVSGLTPSHLSRLLDCEPVLRLRVELATNDQSSTGLFVVSLADELASGKTLLTAVSDVVSVSLPQCDVELTAAQPTLSESPSSWNGQVAIGAVLDGSPLLRRVDGDNDRRLSLRELDAVASLLSTLDRDGDGSVRLGEVPVPLRLTVTLGPHAHTVLGQPSLAPHSTSSADTPAPPPWFASMDLNRDGDLTAAEFLGTRAQFDELDLDQNQRVSTHEAAKSNE